MKSSHEEGKRPSAERNQLGDLPLAAADDDIDLNDEDTDTVDEQPVATERHSHVDVSQPGVRPLDASRIGVPPRRS